MSTKLRVAVGGASGETGLNIINALLADPDRFEAIALARPESVKKAVFIDLEKRGATIKSVIFTDLKAVTAALQAVDVVISGLTIEQDQAEIGLIEASKAAGVKRYVPSFFATICPPRGVAGIREKKEELLDHIKRLYLPYTVVDVGWWYQLSVPSVPSGKLDDIVSVGSSTIYGKGDTEIAYTDNRDIGMYVARIISDPYTLNKHVFAYNEVSTQEKIWSEVEKLTGESIPRKYTSKEDLESGMKISQDAIATNTAAGKADVMPFLSLVTAQYWYSMAIRGDNVPEKAKYLGYLIAKDLYPDLQGTSISTYLKDLVEGRADAKLYVGRPDHPLNKLGK